MTASCLTPVSNRTLSSSISSSIRSCRRQLFARTVTAIISRATGALKQRWPECPLVIGAGDAEKLTNPDLNLSAPFGFPLTSPPADRTLREGDQFDAAGLQFEVLEVPGHSVGHIVLVCKQVQPWRVFGGDVLFAGSIGRTDFPDGSFEDLREAIHNKLFTLPDDTIVYPGHGLETTIGREKRTNPFVGAPAGYTTT